MAPVSEKQGPDTPDKIVSDLGIAIRKLCNLPLESNSGLLIDEVVQAPHRIQALIDDTLTAQAALVQQLEAALQNLVDNCALYEAWQRPCNAYDEARAVLARCPKQ